MLRYTTDRARPGSVALYDIQPGNGAGQFLQPRSPHGALVGINPISITAYCSYCYSFKSLFIFVNLISCF